MTTDLIEQPVAEIRTAVTRWMNVSRAGAYGLVFFAVGLQLVAGEIIPPVLVVGILFAVLGYFLVGERRRLGLVSAVVAAATLVANAPFIVADLAHPEAGWLFSLTVLSVLSAVAVIVGGLGVFFRWSAESIVTIAASLGAVLIFSTISSLVMSASQESDAALSGDVEVTAEHAQFSPGRFVVASGASGVWVDNKDGIRHTLSIDDLGIEVELPPNTSRRIDLTAIPGEYEVYCAVPGHESMKATLVVEG